MPRVVKKTKKRIGELRKKLGLENGLKKQDAEGKEKLKDYGNGWKLCLVGEGDPLPKEKRVWAWKESQDNEGKKTLSCAVELEDGRRILFKTVKYPSGATSVVTTEITNAEMLAEFGP